MNSKLLTYDRLREVLNYNPDTGLFTWIAKASSHITIGATAGRITSEGYLIINIDRLPYVAHRLVWLYTHKVWPTNSLDHINRIRDDNRLANLREATKAENAQNRKLNPINTSGVKGVHWAADRRRWKASIMLNGKLIHLGYTRLFEDAVKLREDGEVKYHPYRIEKI